MAIKRYSSGVYEDELKYIKISELTDIGGPLQYWKLGGTFADAYGLSIGRNSTTKVIDLVTHTLHDGPWAVADATAAASAAGSLTLAGGLYAAKGIYADKGAANAAGHFVDGGVDTFICDGADGIGTNGDITANNSNIKIQTSGDFYHLGNQGVTADGFSGGIKTNEADADEHTEEIATDILMNLAAGGF